jgi:molecular chaperone DnaK
MAAEGHGGRVWRPSGGRGSDLNIDANGILQVAARDKGTGKEQTIKIESASGLSKEEIDRMQRDAQSHAAEDKRRRELAEARNAAEQRVYQLQKLMNENKGRLSDADTAAVRSAIERVDQVKGGEDPSEIRRAVEDLDRASQAMMQHLQGAGATATAGSRTTAGGSGGSSDGAARGSQSDEVIDAEFEEKR